VPVTGEQRVEIEAEGERLFAFLAPDAGSRSIQLVDAG
jgi:hypothetical protein